MVVTCPNDTFPYEETYKEYFNYFDYELSNFQKWSIKAIVDGDHSLITAHTGSGKTLPAEFAIQYFTKQKKKIIYASPLKALSNQKLYDFREKYPTISFGILTGDIKDNPEADVLIMTTEILRNTLFSKQIINGSTRENNENNNHENKQTNLSFEMDFQNELALVCFDEIHFIGDPERGSVWEQSIIMLPKHVQMLMLSATIDKADVFAGWIETQNNYKQVYLSSTNHRVVPLNHYLWLTVNNGHIKLAKKTEYENKISEFINKKIEITSSANRFNEINYYKMYNLKQYFNNHKFNVPRKFVLNELIKHLYNENLLPAIAFVLSRKNVEIFAKEISLNLFEKDECPPPIEYECRQILYKKLNTKTSQDIMQLPEYNNIIQLLNKGIAIHHAGIMPILREMVELLFEKNYIKLLFATETFAVGINMPTKTVIFTGLTKFNGNISRLLYSHEYKQMAGRAGRRGIDTIGHVIHCNNLFDSPSSTDYKKMITGPPQMLTSKFKISYNLILNILTTHREITVGIHELNHFVNKSLISIDIKNNELEYDNNRIVLEDELEKKSNNVQYYKTPLDIIVEYINKKKTITYLTNKSRVKVLREMNTIEEDYISIKSDVEKYEFIIELEKELIELNVKKTNVLSYMNTSIDNIVNILNINNFIDKNVEENKWNITIKGIIASNIQEIHSLVFADLYMSSNGFEAYNTEELVSIFSCFTNLSISDDKKIHNPKSNIDKLEVVGNYLREMYNKYYDDEVKYNANTGTDYNLHFQIMDDVYEWCKSTNEEECICVIKNIKDRHNIFLGEFVKAILKINNISNELEKVCEEIGNIELLSKLKNIPKLTLKYVVTNLSLYV
jgi:superfamily II RNA helicase